MPDSDIRGAFNLDFPEQIEFFRQKISKESQRWNLLSDGTPIEGAMHDAAFIVAGANKADLLDDLRGAVDKAIEKGTGLEEFRKDFRNIVENAAGTTGRAKAQRPGKPGGQGSSGKPTSQPPTPPDATRNWPELLARCPYWKYIHSESVLHPRQEHLDWDGLTLSHDDDFRKTHYPPNDWGCQCQVMAVRALGEDDRTKPPEGWNAPDEKG